MIKKPPRAATQTNSNNNNLLATDQYWRWSESTGTKPVFINVRPIIKSANRVWLICDWTFYVSNVFFVCVFLCMLVSLGCVWLWPGNAHSAPWRNCYWVSFIEVSCSLFLRSARHFGRKIIYSLGRGLRSTAGLHRVRWPSTDCEFWFYCFK